VVVAILAYFLFFREGTVVEMPADESPVSEVAEVSEQATTNVPEPIELPEVDPSIYSVQVAKIFVERFSTYSTQNGNQHIRDVLPMATPVMERWIKTQEVEQSKEYSGVSTRVVTNELISIDGDSAVVKIDVQQIVSNNSGTTIEDKTGRVELVWIDGDWKVDGFFWE